MSGLRALVMVSLMMTALPVASASSLLDCLPAGEGNRGASGPVDVPDCVIDCLVREDCLLDLGSVQTAWVTKPGIGLVGQSVQADATATSLALGSASLTLIVDGLPSATDHCTFGVGINLHLCNLSATVTMPDYMTRCSRATAAVTPALGSGETQSNSAWC